MFPLFRKTGRRPTFNRNNLHAVVWWLFFFFLMFHSLILNPIACILSNDWYFVVLTRSFILSNCIFSDAFLIHDQSLRYELELNVGAVCVLPYGCIVVWTATRDLGSWRGKNVDAWEKVKDRNWISEQQIIAREERSSVNSTIDSPLTKRAAEGGQEWRWSERSVTLSMSVGWGNTLEWERDGGKRKWKKKVHLRWVAVLYVAPTVCLTNCYRPGICIYQSGVARCINCGWRQMVQNVNFSITLL